nr:LiaF domain-containing protein [uncultured Holophaga sp.]
MTPEPETRKNLLSPRLVMGIILIVLGALIGLDQLDLVFLPPHFFISLWPLVLVLLGFMKLRQRPERRTGAYILIGVGAFLLLSRFSHGEVSSLIGPLFLIGIGILVVLGALKRHRNVPVELKQSQDFLQGTAILSGFKQQVTSSDFKGGELTAIMGGFEVDLRQASMVQETARLDVFALFGGGEIRVPEGWNISIQTTAIAGGIHHKAVPAASGGAARPTLVLTGLVLFGGAEVKH